MTALFLTLGIASLIWALILMVRPSIPAAIPTYVAMWMFHLSYHITVAERTFIFWGAATFLLMTIAKMTQKNESHHITLNAYITIGALIGMLLAMTMSANILILGVLIGAVTGMIVYVNTPKGKFIKHSLSTFIHYFCKNALPTVVAMSMIGIIIEGFLLNLANI
jgi:uncharacterized protein YqgC (DUF456 family)